MGWGSRIGALGTVAVTALLAFGAGTGHGQATPPPELVLQPEGNHLWAYDAAGARQLVSRAQNGVDPGAAAPGGTVRDINGQICVSPDGTHLVTGEDTVVPAGEPTGGPDGGSSHDPRIAGWGWFAVTGDRLGEVQIMQEGKLAPEAGSGPGYAGDPDNYGCGFLDAGRLFTTAIGNTLPGEPANGQLFLWFGPFDRGYRQERASAGGVGFFVGEVDHCEIDRTLATAGGIAVTPDGDVYVATNRPGDDPLTQPSAIVRYSGTWPRSAAECTPDHLAEHITRTVVVPNLPLPVDPHAPTPSAVVLSPAGTLYVSSVFTGTVAEYALDGTWLRDVYPTSPLAVPTGPTGDTPFGLAVTSDGTLWISDLGVVGDGPVDGMGSLVRVPFLDGDPVLPAQVVQTGLTFPDGLGVLRPRMIASAPTPEPGPPGSSAPTAASPSAAQLPRTGGAPPMARSIPLLVLGVTALHLVRRLGRVVR